MDLDIHKTLPNPVLVKKFKNFDAFYKWANPIYKGGKEAIKDYYKKSGGKETKKE